LGVIVLAVVLALVAALLLLPSLSDVMSLLGHRHDRSPTRARVPARILHLVPAHNEELLLGECLRSLAAQRHPASARPVVVIADNCTDRTAEVARAAGVQCLERHDATRRGKPHAIAWALEHVDLAHVDAIAIVDADTVVDPGFAAALAAAGPLEAKVVQPYNDVANRSDNALTRMAAVLSAAIHRFAFGLKTRAGRTVPLSAGMCMGRDILRRYGWGAFSICEDWEMYARLTAERVPIESVIAARIFAQEARSLKQGASQRRRWMAGKATVLLRYAWPLLRSPIRFGQKLDVLAELSAPGPAVHLAAAVSGAALAWLLAVPAAPWIALAFLLSLLRWSIYTLAALRVDPEPGRAALAFAYLPFYTVWRAAVAVAALPLLRAPSWVRTARHSPTDAGVKP
jgi:1,2-diacylglycerol 3-beta-glucosyltransferase